MKEGILLEKVKLLVELMLFELGERILIKKFEIIVYVLSG